MACHITSYYVICHITSYYVILRRRNLGILGIPESAESGGYTLSDMHNRVRPVGDTADGGDEGAAQTLGAETPVEAVATTTGPRLRPSAAKVREPLAAVRALIRGSARTHAYRPAGGTADGREEDGRGPNSGSRNVHREQMSHRSAQKRSQLHLAALRRVPAG